MSFSRSVESDDACDEPQRCGSAGLLMAAAIDRDVNQLFGGSGEVPHEDRKRGKVTVEATTPHLKVKHSVLECIDSMARKNFCHAMMIKRPLTHHQFFARLFCSQHQRTPLGTPTDHNHRLQPNESLHEPCPEFSHTTSMIGPPALQFVPGRPLCFHDFYKNPTLPPLTLRNTICQSLSEVSRVTSASSHVTSPGLRPFILLIHAHGISFAQGHQLALHARSAEKEIGRETRLVIENRTIGNREQSGQIKGLQGLQELLGKIEVTVERSRHDQG